MIMLKLLRSYKQIVHLPFRELQDNSYGSVMNTYILMDVKSLIRVTGLLA